MKVKEIEAKSIIVKTNLSEGDFVINPYIGCEYGCKYCYARFMKRFTGHEEAWGSFIDVKINAPDLIPSDTKKYKNKFVIIGSVTDAYQPIEKKYKITRQILEKLIFHQPKVDILTKSDLVLRDIGLIKQFKHCIVAISLAFLDEKIRKKLEPLACSVKERINTLKELHRAKVKTALFVSPIFPELTDWKKLINETESSVDEYWFENLNLYPSIRKNIYDFLRRDYSGLIEKYKEIYSKDSDYWQRQEKEIKAFCKSKKINCRICFHHKKRN